MASLLSHDLWLENCCKNRSLGNLCSKVTCAPRKEVFGGVSTFLWQIHHDLEWQIRETLFCAVGASGHWQSLGLAFRSITAMNIAKNVFILKYVTNCNWINHSLTMYCIYNIQVCNLEQGYYPLATMWVQKLKVLNCQSILSRCCCCICNWHMLLFSGFLFALFFPYFSVSSTAPIFWNWRMFWISLTFFQAVWNNCLNMSDLICDEKKS